METKRKKNKEKKKKKKLYKASDTFKFLQIWRQYIGDMKRDSRNQEVYYLLQKKLQTEGITLNIEEIKQRIDYLTDKYIAENKKVWGKKGYTTTWIYYNAVHKVLNTCRNVFDRRVIVVHESLEAPLLSSKIPVKVIPSSKNLSSSSTSATKMQSTKNLPTTSKISVKTTQSINNLPASSIIPITTQPTNKNLSAPLKVSATTIQSINNLPLNSKVSVTTPQSVNNLPVSSGSLLMLSTDLISNSLSNKSIIKTEPASATSSSGSSPIPVLFPSQYGTIYINPPVLSTEPTLTPSAYKSTITNLPALSTPLSITVPDPLKIHSSSYKPVIINKSADLPIPLTIPSASPLTESQKYKCTILTNPISDSRPYKCTVASIEASSSPTLESLPSDKSTIKSLTLPPVTSTPSSVTLPIPVTTSTSSFKPIKIKSVRSLSLPKVGKKYLRRTDFKEDCLTQKILNLMEKECNVFCNFTENMSPIQTRNLSAMEKTNTLLEKLLQNLQNKV